jgi:PAS domain S-box-containing protein
MKQKEFTTSGPPLEVVESLADFLANAPIGIRLIGSDLRVLWANQTELDMLGYDGTEYIGQDYSQFFVDPEYSTKVCEKLMGGETIRGMKRQMIRKDGGLIDVVINSNVYWKEGKFVHTRCFTRDISELVAETKAKENAEKLACELADTHKKLEASHLARQQFLSFIVHELRNPLNAIVHSVEFLLESNLSQEQYELAQTVDECSNLMIRLCNDLLDLDKIDSGKMELESIQFCLRDICASAIKSVSALVNKDVKLEMDYDELIPERIYGDPTRISQILNNLLSNAGKFTKTGSIKLTVKREVKEYNAKVKIKMTVNDTGIGIPSNKQIHLFQDFQQMDNSIAREYGGSGLGLSIVKRLADLMRGSVSVKSIPDKGSEFCVLITLDAVQQDNDCIKEHHFDAEKSTPVCSQKSTIVKRHSAQEVLKRSQKKTPRGSLTRSAFNFSQTKGRILVVDDLEVNRKLLQRVLLAQGFCTQTANDGIEALQILSEDLNFDLVLTDLNMPGMSGNELAHQLRTKNFPGKIVLASGSDSSDIETDILLLFDGFLRKPFVQEHLLQVIQHILPISKITESESEQVANQLIFASTPKKSYDIVIDTEYELYDETGPLSPAA